RAGRRTLAHDELARVRPTTRDEIDDTAKRLRTVQRRRRTFDDFGLPEVEWPNIHERKPARLPAEQRQSVIENRGVASGKSLDPDVRGAKWRSCLHPNAAHFAE